MSPVRSAASFSAGSAVAWKSARSVLDCVPVAGLASISPEPSSGLAGWPVRKAPAPPASDVVRLARLQDHYLRGDLRLDVGFERLGIGLDRREGIEVDRDHGFGTDELAGDDGVVAVHRVVAADRNAEDVDVAAPRAQLHFAERTGVASVVDGRLADLDHQAGGGAEGDPVLGAEGGLFG